jgi:hypothetical protein
MNKKSRIGIVAVAAAVIAGGALITNEEDHKTTYPHYVVKQQSVGKYSVYDRNKRMIGKDLNEEQAGYFRK